MKRPPARIAIVWVAAVFSLLAGCKSRDWRSQLPLNIDRPKPAWAEVVPNEPGVNWFAVGQNRFDTPSGRLRAPLMAEMQARQQLARDIRASAEAAAEVMIAALADSSTAHEEPHHEADGETDMLQQLARDSAERVVQRVGKHARVLDEWLDENAREYFVLVVVPFRHVRFVVYDDIRREWPAASAALLPAALVRALLVAKQRQRRIAPYGANLADGIEPDLRWPATEPNEPGRRYFAGVNVFRPVAEIDPEPVIDLARLRLADRMAGIIEPVLIDFFLQREWAETRRRGERMMAIDVAANVACEVAESAAVMMLALDPPETARSSPATGADMPQPAIAALPPREFGAWYAPRQLRPRPCRVLVAVDAPDVTAHLMRWLQRLGGPFTSAEIEAMALEMSQRLANEQARQLGSRSFTPTLAR